VAEGKEVPHIEPLPKEDKKDEAEDKPPAVAPAPEEKTATADGEEKK
jgi:hypothetical protein